NDLYRITNPKKLICFEDQKFTEIKSLGSLRIVALGGSSVQFLGLGEHFDILERDLLEEFKGKYKRVEIINAGGASYGTGRLVLVLKEMLQYDPDMVLLYAGHNEFEELAQLKLVKVGYVRFMDFMSNFAIYRFFRDRLTDVWISILENEHNKRLLSMYDPVIQPAWHHNFTEEEDLDRMEAYENNLSLIINICQKNGISLVIGTVSSNLVMPFLPEKERKEYYVVYGLIKKKEYKEALKTAREILKATPGRHQSSDLENEIIRKLSKKHNILLADVEQKIMDNEPHGIPGEKLFADHCHLNKKGNVLLIETYKDSIIEIVEDEQR
ncbi:MAG: SGNH/GDSL hydrolase family protein, partial [Candidatus Tantalella remota]|nr:SGNH/GDSL hydrolase family protein [Candidatus Tantalella remota]